MLNICCSIPTFSYLPWCLEWCHGFSFLFKKPVDLVILKLASPETVVIE